LIKIIYKRKIIRVLKFNCRNYNYNKSIIEKKEKKEKHVTVLERNFKITDTFKKSVNNYIFKIIN